MFNSFVLEEVKTDGQRTMPILRLPLRRVALPMLRLLKVLQPSL